MNAFSRERSSGRSSGRSVSRVGIMLSATKAAIVPAAITACPCSKLRAIEPRANPKSVQPDAQASPAPALLLCQGGARFHCVEDDAGEQSFEAAECFAAT